jgi:hypothetical protein
VRAQAAFPSAPQGPVDEKRRREEESGVSETTLAEGSNKKITNERVIMHTWTMKKC